MKTGKEQSEEEKQGLLAAYKDAPSGKDVEAASKASADAPAIGMFGLGFTGLAIAYYAACSSTMLVINKVAIHQLPCPMFVLCCQLFVSAAVVGLLNQTGHLIAERADWAKLQKFIWVVLGCVALQRLSKLGTAPLRGFGNVAQRALQPP
jgi:hypothetical protein